MPPNFWKKVAKRENGCWEWTGVRNKPGGYGRLNIKGKFIQAHRYSYEMHNGPIPEGLLVLHKCDNKLCVNPEHLEIGTTSKNMKDAFDRGLFVPKSKLDQSMVDSILSSREPLKVLAEIYGVTEGAISHVRTGRNWKRR